MSAPTAKMPPGTELPANDPPPRWRTVRDEARRRGFVDDDGTPNTRAFREWCERYQVPLYGTGKYQLVEPAALDDALDRVALSDDDESAAAAAAAQRTLKGRS